jgi:hypothetical protein
MDRGRVSEDRGSKETDGCPLTGPLGMKVVGFWVWSLEMVPRCYRGVGNIHMNRGS